MPKRKQAIESANRQKCSHLSDGRMGHGRTDLDGATQAKCANGLLERFEREVLIREDTEFAYETRIQKRGMC